MIFCYQLFFIVAISPNIVYATWFLHYITKINKLLAYYCDYGKSQHTFTKWKKLAATFPMMHIESLILTNFLISHWNGRGSNNTKCCKEVEYSQIVIIKVARKHLANHTSKRIQCVCIAVVVSKRIPRAININITRTVILETGLLFLFASLHMEHVSLLRELPGGHPYLFCVQPRNRKKERSRYIRHNDQIQSPSPPPICSVPLLMLLSLLSYQLICSLIVV